MVIHLVFFLGALAAYLNLFYVILHVMVYGFELICLLFVLIFLSLPGELWNCYSYVCRRLPAFQRCLGQGSLFKNVICSFVD